MSTPELKFYKSDEQTFNFIKLLIYGPPGVGKTRTSCIDAQGTQTPGPILLLSAESGTMSIRDVKGVTILDLKPDPNNPDDVDPSTGAIKRDGVDKLLAVYKLLQGGKHPYKTVVLDSVTELQKMFLARAVSDSGKGNVIPEQRHWGIAQERTRSALRMFRDLPLNVILIALLSEIKDELSGEVTLKPSLSGKAADEIAAFMDLVAMMAKVTIPPPEGSENKTPTVRRVWIFDGKSNAVTKDRSGILPAVTPASFAWVYDKIYSHPTSGDPRVSTL